MKTSALFFLIFVTNGFCFAQFADFSYTDVFDVDRLITEHGVFSKENPSRLISLDSSFSYLGMFDFEIAANSEFPEEVLGKNIAAGERIIFVDDDNGLVKRVIIFQFEGFLPEFDFTYNYSFEGADSIGGIPYRNNVWFYNETEFAEENPGGVAFRTRELIRENGFEYPDEIIMSRIVMVTNPERSHELIISFIETGLSNNLVLERWENNDYSEEFKKVFTEKIKSRALNSIQFDPIRK